jgi:hypothetical protein
VLLTRYSSDMSTSKRTRKKAPTKRQVFFQMRTTVHQLSRWKARAAIYAGGNLSLLFESAIEEWVPRFLVTTRGDPKNRSIRTSGDKKKGHK